MATPQQIRFAAEHDVSVENLKKLIKLGNKRGTIAVYECNGDPFEGIDPSDKDACSTAWGREVEKLDRMILALAEIMRFDTVDFGSGLYPALQKGKHTYHLPF
jgi:hypothetical protein